MRIQIVGPECPRCNATEQNVISACVQMALDAEVSHIRDGKQVAQLGVRFTPAVIVDGKIAVPGKFRRWMS